MEDPITSAPSVCEHSAGYFTHIVLSPRKGLEK